MILFFLSVRYIYFLRIFQNVASHAKPFLSVWFQTKHQVGMWRWCCIFLAPHIGLPYISTYLSCNRSKLWIVSKVLPNQHAIIIQTEVALIFMENILSKIDHRKIVMAITCKQLGNFKALSITPSGMMRFLLFFLKYLSNSPAIPFTYSMIIFISPSNKSCRCFA